MQVLMKKSFQADWQRNADSPTEDNNGEVLFVKPWEEQQPFDNFVDFLTEQELSGVIVESIEEVRYAQTRTSTYLSEVPVHSNFSHLENDNLRNEYAALFSHVEKDIPWARIALQQKPDAINLWIGNSLSTSALHKDNYENIYVQIIGQKHFVLLPPVSYACVAERDLPPASYSRNDGGRLELRKEDGESVPFATWDPDQPGKNDTKYSRYAKPVRVILEEGDMLYLPALWYVSLALPWPTPKELILVTGITKYRSLARKKDYVAQ
jgi:jumonji domain-containing protein 7